jgi:formylglycine-generating enzyme required for sulfatase activity
MGSPEDEVGRISYSEEQRQVTLTRDFYMGVTEVTHLEYETVMGWDPSLFKLGDSYPVNRLNWYEAVAYAIELSLREGLSPCYSIDWVRCIDFTYPQSYLDCFNPTQGGIDEAQVNLIGGTTPYECEGYRLPTDTEWEYAARSGTTAAFYNGGNLLPGHDDNCQGNLQLDNGTYLDDIAWYCGNDTGTMQPVGGLHPNRWGLYDTSGNAWEWVWDGYMAYDGESIDPTGREDSTLRVVRGGRFSLEPNDQRVARRSYDELYWALMSQGFRLARTVDP